MKTQQTYTEEWKRFGPWIDPVGSEAEVPPLFRPHPLDLDKVRLVLKVPRDIPHRDARPDMDLYDHLVIIDQAAVTVLTRAAVAPSGLRLEARPHGYVEQSIALRDLVALHDAVNLLHGQVTLHARSGGSISMRHSGSPRGGVERLVDALRIEMEARPAGPWGVALLKAAESATPNLHVLEKAGDIGVGGAVQDLRAEHRGVEVWACHGHRKVWPEGSGVSGAMKRMRHMVAPMTVQAGVLAGDERMLEILGRHAWMVRGNVPTISSSRLTMALADVDGVTVTPHPVYPTVVTVELHAGQAVLPVTVPAGASMVGLLSAGGLMD